MERAVLTGQDRIGLQALRRFTSDWTGVPEAAVRVARSPYRICPLGAHVDHQLGMVTGLALDFALMLAFVPAADGTIEIRSRQFQGVARFDVADMPERPSGDWADYARGAAFALGGRYSLRRGMRAVVDGRGHMGGLSSSGAFGVACLLALESANGLALGPEENIELDRVIENEYIGLSNGILDQSIIVLGRPGQLVHLDCESRASRLVPLGRDREVGVAVLYSGLERQLTGTDYNQRVEECRQAAGLLLEAGGLRVPQDARLRSVPAEVFRKHGAALPERLRKRAAHYFGEVARVIQGVDLWGRGDLEGFGRLMSESCESSMGNYECGTPHLQGAYRALQGCSGVYGARFSGGGFGGCCVALAAPESQAEVTRLALARYLGEHPEMEQTARVFFCKSGQGAGLIR